MEIGRATRTAALLALGASIPLVAITVGGLLKARSDTDSIGAPTQARDVPEPTTIKGVQPSLSPFAHSRPAPEATSPRAEATDPSPALGGHDAGNVLSRLDWKPHLSALRAVGDARLTGKGSGPMDMSPTDLAAMARFLAELQPLYVATGARDIETLLRDPAVQAAAIGAAAEDRVASIADGTAASAVSARIRASVSTGVYDGRSSLSALTQARDSLDLYRTMAKETPASVRDELERVVAGLLADGSEVWTQRFLRSVPEGSLGGELVALWCQANRVSIVVSSRNAADATGWDWWREGEHEISMLRGRWRETLDEVLRNEGMRRAPNLRAALECLLELRVAMARCQETAESVLRRGLSAEDAAKLDARREVPMFVVGAR